MKQAAMAVAVLALGTFAAAQQPAPAASTPAKTPAGQSQPATTAPAAGQAATTPPVGKRPPQAKTQAEFDAYNAAKTKANDPAAFEKATDDFAAKFPGSELTVLMYRDAMHGYQSANNADKMLEMGRKVLSLDKDDPEALIGVAEVLTERAKDTDLDKDQRMAEAVGDANHALETIDTDIAVPAGTPQERVDAYKNFLRSGAYAVLGTQAFNAGAFADAEKMFRQSIDVFASQPDAVVVLRLALALDKQNKYPGALKEANHAVELSQDGTSVGTLARRERDRLVQLTGGTVPGATATPPASTPAPATPATTPAPATPKK
jgi:tetratricopeptide (TPR) repeat protein